MLPTIPGRSQVASAESIRAGSLLELRGQIPGHVRTGEFCRVQGRRDDREGQGDQSGQHCPHRHTRVKHG